MKKIIFIGSAGGAVLSKLLEHSFVRDSSLEAVSDRKCGFLEVAENKGLKSLILPAADGGEFSDLLYARYQKKQEAIFLSFYTKILKGDLLKLNSGAIFNCHPSLLPAFKGLHGFEDTIRSTALFMGCTLHQIDAGMDSGPPLIQAALPIDRKLPFDINRHKIFLAQYYSTLQFIKWVHEDRLKIDDTGSFFVNGATYHQAPFSPNLDADFFSSTGIKNELT